MSQQRIGDQTNALPSPIRRYQSLGRTLFVRVVGTSLVGPALRLDLVAVYLFSREC
jgi:hypothetical protein